MRDDDSFEFDQDQHGGSTFPAVLLAAVAIAAILFVNTTGPISAATAAEPASTPEATSVKVIPALLDDVQPQCAPRAVAL